MYKNSTNYKFGLRKSYAAKILLVMRLMTVILLTSMLQVSAAGFAQQVTLKQKSITLNQVFKAIEKQTGYSIIYYEKIINTSARLNVNFDKTPVDQVLKKIFNDKQISFTIDGKDIILKDKEESFVDKIINAITPMDEQPDSLIWKGRVVDSLGKPLPGATVSVKGSKLRTYTTQAGEFAIKASPKATLIISYIGCSEVTVDLSKQNNKDWIRVSMNQAFQDLESVKIVSTGYQKLPKDRATGSFELIDNKLFNRATGTNVIPRLLGTAAGIFIGGQRPITIRGISSLALNGRSPLIILDNIPYEGDVNNINPNDVENITILKDAAAASIWGTRAGNGVIVITTKKGQFNKKIELSLNTNTTFIEKPNLFSLPVINSSEEIDLEKYLFSKGFFNGRLNTITNPGFLSPVVELLAKQRNLPVADLLGRATIDMQIDDLKKYDVRNDYLKYFFRTAINQQYSFNVAGGGEQISYNFSTGYDKNLNSTLYSDNDRITLRSYVSLKPIKNLNISTQILYTTAKSNNIGDGTITTYSPGNVYQYARLADNNGNPLAPKAIYRTKYVDSLSRNPNLLSYINKPLDELDRSKSSVIAKDILLSVEANYTINKILSAQISYQYQNTNSNSALIYNADSFYTRQIINQFTNPSTFERGIPIGAIYNSSSGMFSAQTVRGNLNLEKKWNNKHQLVMIAGAEARQNSTESYDYGTKYGYDLLTRTFQSVDSKYPVKTYDGGEQLIPYFPSINGSFNRFTSLFTNASYTYKDRYIISGSVRKDASNVFGDNANKQGTPLWSGGISWNISKESFFSGEVFNYLKIRATYGYSGNVISGVPAYSVVEYSSFNDPNTGFPFATSGNAPNPNLRWEKVGQINVGLDFSVFQNKVSGSIEYYNKSSEDLIVSSPVDLTTGFSSQTLNGANLNGKGIDMTINTLNVNKSLFKWNSTLLFSYNKIITKKYLFQPSSVVNYVNGSNGLNPVEGRDAYSIYAFQSAGLTGDPRGYLNGVISKDYNLIMQQTRLEDLKYYGSAVPRYFGALRNTFAYKRIELSLNIIYKFDFFFKRNGLDYSTLFRNGSGNSEYLSRWMTPGDEAKTEVPSLVYPNNSERNTFYQLSTSMIDKGDNIRLQDITLSYILPKIKSLRGLRLFGNINNLGLLWKANKLDIDPDSYNSYRPSKVYAIGINASL